MDLYDDLFKFIIYIQSFRVSRLECKSIDTNDNDNNKTKKKYVYIEKKERERGIPNNQQISLHYYNNDDEKKKKINEQQPHVKCRAMRVYRVWNNFRP